MNSVEEYLNIWGLERAFADVALEELRVKKYEDGEPLFYIGEDVKYVYLLVEGRCRLYGLSFEGKEVLVNFKEAPGIFGDIEVVLGLDFQLSMTAWGEAVVLQIPLKIVQKKLLYNVDFLRFLTYDMSKKIYFDSAQQVHLLLKKSKVRVAKCLMLLQRVEEKEQFFFSCGALARDSGISERHLTRILKELEQDGIIRRAGRMIQILNAEKLEDIVKV